MNKEEYQLACKNFDKTHCELQRCCEDKCRKYKLDKLEWFLRITEIGVRLCIYKWIAGFKQGKKCNILNLERACRNNLKKSKGDLKSKYCPRVMSLEEAERKAAACEQELDNLKDEAPFLRTEHLQDMLDKAWKKGNENKEKALLIMLRKEYDRKQNGQLRSAFGKPVSNSASCVALTPPRRRSTGDIQRQKRH